MRDYNSVLERLLEQDRAVRESGQNPLPTSEAAIVDFISEHELFESSSARDWLIKRAGSEDYRVVRRIMGIVQILIEKGHYEVALSVFLELIPPGQTEKAIARRTALLGPHSIFVAEVKRILETHGLITTHFESWGSTLVQLESDLLHANQLADQIQVQQPHGAEPRSEAADDYHQLAYFHPKYRNHDALHIVIQAMERTLLEASTSSTGDAFRGMADQLIATNWGLAKSQPLVALVDARKTAKCTAWHAEEAVRLLTNHKILHSYTAYSWRRLLRRNILPILQPSQVLDMAGGIRGFVEPSLQLSELSDIAETGLLTTPEIDAIEAARRRDELSDPYDPRELRRIVRDSQLPTESNNDLFVKRWPIEAERPQIRALVERQDPAPNITLSELEPLLFPRLNTLRRVAERCLLHDRFAVAEVLRWCADAITDLKVWLGLACEAPSSAEYLEALDMKCSWWRICADVAFRRLQGPVPSSHFSHDGESIHYWSGDSFAASFKFFDELLVASEHLELTNYAATLDDTVSKNWNDWPRFTRGLAIWLLRPFHWRSPSMRDCLIRVIRQTNDSDTIELALNNLLGLGQPGVTELMSELLARIDTLSDPHETAQLIGHATGNAAIRFRTNQETLEELRRLSEWLDVLMQDRIQRWEIRSILIAEILSAFEEFIASCDKNSDALAVEWLAVVNWGIGEWLSSGNDDHDIRHLPNSPIRFMAECAWSVEILKRLLSGFHETLLRIVRDGGLGEFYLIHYQLIDPVQNSRVVAEIADSERPVFTFSTDQHKLQLCRASAERVTEWRRANKRTNDLAYASCLAGMDTQKLIECCFDFADDRPYVRRELASVVDILADAELREVANELRISLRRH